MATSNGSAAEKYGLRLTIIQPDGGGDLAIH